MDWYLTMVNYGWFMCLNSWIIMMLYNAISCPGGLSRTSSVRPLCLWPSLRFDVERNTTAGVSPAQCALASWQSTNHLFDSEMRKVSYIREISYELHLMWWFQRFQKLYDLYLDPDSRFSPMELVFVKCEVDQPPFYRAALAKKVECNRLMSIISTCKLSVSLDRVSGDVLKPHCLWHVAWVCPSKWSRAFARSWRSGDLDAASSFIKWDTGTEPANFLPCCELQPCGRGLPARLPRCRWAAERLWVRRFEPWDTSDHSCRCHFAVSTN